MSFFSTRTQAEQISTDAEYRAFIKNMKDDLEACGWIATSDPQIDPVAKTASDGSITSGTAVLTSPTITFAASDVGRQIIVTGAGVAGGNLVTTILSFTNSTTVTLAANASTTVTGTGGITIGPQKPAAGNTKGTGHSLCYRMNDSLHGTGKKVIAKIIFGTGNTATSMGLWLTVGTDSDGAGNITGQMMTEKQCAANGSSSTSRTMVTCGDTNRFIVCVNYDSSSSTRVFGFSIERTLDGSGADTNTGIMVFASGVGSFSSATSGSKWFFIPYTGTVIEVQRGSILVPTNQSSGVYGSDVGFYPVFFEDRGQLLNPSLNMVCYFTADMSAGSQFTITAYGATHNYFNLGANTGPIGRNAETGSVMAMRFE